MKPISGLDLAALVLQADHESLQDQSAEIVRYVKNLNSEQISRVLTIKKLDTQLASKRQKLADLEIRKAAILSGDWGKVPDVIEPVKVKPADPAEKSKETPKP